MIHPAQVGSRFYRCERGTVNGARIQYGAAIGYHAVAEGPR